MGGDDALRFTQENPEFSDICWLLMYEDEDGGIYFEESETMKELFEENQ